MDDNAHRFTVTLDHYDAVVNSVRYREEGHRDDWLIGDLYIKNQALPEPPPTRIEVTVSHLKGSPRGDGSADGPIPDAAERC